MQIDIELPVREVAARPVGPVHGQRGLPDSTSTGDGGDQNRAGPAGVGRQQRVEAVQMIFTAGEVG